MPAFLSDVIQWIWHERTKLVALVLVLVLVAPQPARGQFFIDWAAINRARGIVGAVQGIYNAIRGLVNLNVASATLANPRQLETVILSRNPGSIGQVPRSFTTVYQTIPAPTDAHPA